VILVPVSSEVMSSSVLGTNMSILTTGCTIIVTQLVRGYQEDQA